MSTREQDAPAVDGTRTGSWLEVLAVFFRLGLTSFGGPVAHLGYFREEFVRRRRCLDDRSYADLVALCQFLPGPASSQVGIAIGLLRAGYTGALAAWMDSRAYHYTRGPQPQKRINVVVVEGQASADYEDKG